MGKRAEDWARKQMYDESLKGKKWRTKADAKEDFDKKVKVNLEALKFAPILVIFVIIAIAVSLKYDYKANCDHHFNEIEYQVNIPPVLPGYSPTPKLEGYCRTCKKEFSISIDSYEVISETQPTCTSYGVKTCVGKFTFKEKEYERQFTMDGKKPLGHLMEEILSPYTEPTCQADGHYDTYYCARCSVLVEGKVIPKLPHTEVVNQRVEPTCQNAGYTEYTMCSVCNEALSEYDVLVLQLILVQCVMIFMLIIINKRLFIMF